MFNINDLIGQLKDYVGPKFAAFIIVIIVALIIFLYFRSGSKINKQTIKGNNVDISGIVSNGDKNKIK